MRGIHWNLPQAHHSEACVKCFGVHPLPTYIKNLESSAHQKTFLILRTL